MKNTILAIIFAAGAAVNASAQCPSLQMTGPSVDVLAGDYIMFVMNVSGGDAKVLPKYNWAVSAGKIVSGQGTPVIKVDSTGLDSQDVTATAEVIGYPPECRTTASTTSFVKAAPKAQKFDEFGAENNESEWARLDSFTIGLQNDPVATGYIIVYGGRKSKKTYAATTIKRMRTYLVKQRGMDNNRIITINGGLREKPSCELWLVPQGATPPDVSPTIKPKPTIKKPTKKTS